VTLSIIIPTLNEGHSIARTLESLQPLRARGHEIIVVDGGSEDATVSLCRPLADRLIHAQRGRARQMNAGAVTARGDIFVFLHADTRLPNSADRMIVKVLSKNACQWGRFDVRLSGRNVLFKIISALMNVRSRVTGIATGDQTIFVRRNAFERIGRFPDIPLMEDVAISKALRRVSRPGCIRRKSTTSSRRWKQCGIGRTIIKMWVLRLRYALGADPADLARAYDVKSRFKRDFLP
jgi:rSAM/selenodomain-associated transferase 2